jgi:hypothetical protein
MVTDRLGSGMPVQRVPKRSSTRATHLSVIQWLVLEVKQSPVVAIVE